MKISVAIGFLVFVLGFVGACILLKVHLISIGTSFSIGQLIQTIVTIVLAVVVAQHFKKSGETDAREMDIIFSHFNLINKELDSLESVLEYGDQLKIVSGLKKISLGFDALNSVLNQCGETSKAFTSIALGRQIRDLRKVITYTPIEQSERAEISFSKGVYTYSEGRIELIFTDIQKLRLALLRSQIDINRV